MKKILGLSAIFVFALFLSACSSLFNKNNNGAELVSEFESEIENVVYEEGVKNFVLNSEESEAEYSLNEILRGVPTFVVGKNSNIYGNIVVDTREDFELIGGEIKLDASSFKTDISNRDNNVANLILRVNEPGNEFITFVPKEIQGLEEALVYGEDKPIIVSGDLTISGITQETIFNGILNFEDENNVNGFIESELTYANFGLSLPDFDFFTDVDEIVKIKINFKASSK